MSDMDARLDQYRCFMNELMQYSGVRSHASQTCQDVELGKGDAFATWCLMRQGESRPDGERVRYITDALYHKDAGRGICSRYRQAVHSALLEEAMFWRPETSAEEA